MESARNTREFRKPYIVINSHNHRALCGGLLGLCFFLLIFGAATLDPQNIGWLLQANNQDSVQHLVGWEFFRNEPWHFPLGIIQNYGFPVSTSIVYTDSIPIFALIFKCFADYLPTQFQYFGIWFAMCYFLQGLFGWLIAEEITHNTWIKIFVTVFFLLSPIMLNRTFEHQALAAQWVLLAAVYFYVKPYALRTNHYWLALNILTVLIHAYLVVMVLSIWCAYLYKNVYLDYFLTGKQALREIAINITAILLTAWITGYFVVSLTHGIEAGGYNLDSMNLFAPFIPSRGSPVIPGNWSLFVKPLHGFQINQIDEGFNYFGFGMLLLIAVSIYHLIRHFPPKHVLSDWLPLILICIGFIIYSLSNMITAGPRLLLQYPLPEPLLIIGDIFRASGRFFWPVYYLVMTGVFYLLCRRLNKIAVISLLGIAMFFQVADMSFKLRQTHQFFSQLQPIKSELNTPFWQEAGKHYTKMVFLPHIKNPQARIKDFQEYIHYAAQHQMKVNLGYFAREDTSKIYFATRQLLIEAAQQQLDPQSIYIIVKPEIAAVMRGRVKQMDKMERIGRYMMIAPGWKQA